MADEKKKLLNPIGDCGNESLFNRRGLITLFKRDQPIRASLDEMC